MSRCAELCGENSVLNRQNAVEKVDLCSVRVVIGHQSHPRQGLRGVLALGFARPARVARKRRLGGRVVRNGARLPLPAPRS